MGFTWALDAFLNTDNPYFEGMVNQIRPSELHVQLNKAYNSNVEDAILDLYLNISNGFALTKTLSFRF